MVGVGEQGRLHARLDLGRPLRHRRVDVAVLATVAAVLGQPVGDPLHEALGRNDLVRADDEDVRLAFRFRCHPGGEDIADIVVRNRQRQVDVWIGGLDGVVEMRHEDLHAGLLRLLDLRAEHGRIDAAEHVDGVELVVDRVLHALHPLRRPGLVFPLDDLEAELLRRPRSSPDRCSS